MLDKVNKALAGGINYGYIVNIIAGSGAGKTSLTNQCVSYWMKERDVNVGVYLSKQKQQNSGRTY